jgi:5,10-methylenetetrahydromethanopterin reductase
MKVSRFVFPEGSFASYVEAIARCDTQGAHAVWVPQVFSWDAMTALAAAAARTQRVRLGTAVLPAYTTHPLAMAATAMSVQAASAGRLTLGIGAAHRFLVEGSWGGSYARPVERMRDYLSALRPAMACQSVDVHTELLTARMDSPLTLPGTGPPPVLLAALQEKMLALAGRAADGTVTWLAGPKTLRDHIAPVLLGAADRHGRPRPRIVAALPVCVTGQPEAARRLARARFDRYTRVPSYRAVLAREGVDDIPDIALIGDEDHIGERLARLRAAGVDEFAALAFGDQEGVTRTEEFLARFGAGNAGGHA